MKKNTAHELKLDILNRLHTLHLTVGSLNAALGLLGLADECKKNFDPKERFEEIFAFVVDDLLKRKWAQIYQPDEKTRIMQQEGKVKAADDTLIALTYEGVSECENQLKQINEPNNVNSMIKIENVSSSSININADNNSSIIQQDYIEPTLFSEMRNAILSSQLEPETKKQLNSEVELLLLNHKRGSFSEGYKDFMQNTSAHITVFTPFLTLLASLL
ncbi:hypothetical protein SG34_007400 [Thalassomonas viridans]|uniref:AbiTii domain-containing protein n=1 Tax=Thalassomonas viridans TaxID=137584 RepID=A0AAF0CAN7_9GAMM|nr:hypothetical protein [Thalassomonas viridans]WDE06721.1 hypothetical protein SG34_007400 [Thalassomonas viridans]